MNRGKDNNGVGYTLSFSPHFESEGDWAEGGRTTNDQIGCFAALSSDSLKYLNTLSISNELSTQNGGECRTQVGVVLTFSFAVAMGYSNNRPT